MISKAITTVILAGFVAGILVTGAQMLRVTPLILQAEKYEVSAEAVPHTHQHSGITHAHELNGVAPEVHSVVTAAHGSETAAHAHDQNIAHSHAAENWAPADGVERTFYTAVSNIVTGIAFSLMLVAVYLLRGKPVSMNSGLLWGAAGFLVFSGSPALGLPPELPGMTAAALESRQAWWIGTVIATAIGIGLFTESKTILPKIAAALLLAAPHLIGAPHPLLFESNVPAELSAQFAIASLLTSAFFWMVLGASTGYLYKKLVLESSGVFLKTSSLNPQ
ncbi:MAG: CbtA family protein [SAR324 cluster bacterium]|nr:CbtA family protein [SAR324 cluster bacterium]MBL7035555.1 CbtA family protein [SAR324 cluster bacterium]